MLIPKPDHDLNTWFPHQNFAYLSFIPPVSLVWSITTWLISPQAYQNTADISTLTRKNYIDKIQQDAGIYLLHIYSTCFGCPSHPSSGVHETVLQNNFKLTFLLDMANVQLTF